MFAHGWFWMPFIMFLIFASMARAGRMRRGQRYWGWGWAPPEWSGRRGREGSEGRPEGEPQRDPRRDEQMEQLETRVAELESRLDFAERLLARRDPANIPPGTPS